MNFLNPLVLLGLGAAALPFLIHLFSKRRIKDVAFPSIEFLELMKTNRMRRLKLKQFLVLLLRTLIIIMVILAFARPAINSAFQKNARTSVVIIIDGSASMEYVHDGEVLFQNALRKAREILDMLGEDDTAAVILSTDVPTLVGQGLTTNKKKLAEALKSLENSLTADDANRSFAMALDILDSSSFPNRELYYITDGADNTLPDAVTPRKHPVRNYIVLSGPETRVGSVIERIDLTDRLVTPGKPVTFRVRGHLISEDDEMNVEFFVNSERKGRSSAVRRSGDSVETEFLFTPEAPGRYSVYATADDGRFQPGETRRIVVNVPRKTHVLLVGGAPQDMYFLHKALDPDPERSMFLITEVLVADLKKSEIAQADVVVLSGVSRLSDSLYKSLLAAVAERGKGLVVFPPEDMDESLYSNGIFRDMFPAEVEKRVTLNGKSGNYALIDWFDISHPVLLGVSDKGQFQKPEAASYIRMRPTGNVRVLGRFNDGSMAIGNSVCGKGRVAVFAVDASPGDSELPITGIFVPLFIRTVQYLSGTGILGGRYETGDNIHDYIGDISRNISVSIKPENGPAYLVDISRSEDGVYVKGKSAGKPGFYSVQAGGVEQARFSVDIPVSEIVFKRSGITKLSEVFKDVKWKAIDDSENLSEIILKDRYGSELYGIFLLLAGVFIALEMVVSRKA